ncbi:GNAT family N-acetyltransferase [Chitinimonas sp.]|uniref:GNAT family N-acetyltransferase n=1 Tax=Chitinimonas sp. TaxID=1934313 RepID=UPI0035ADFF19
MNPAPFPSELRTPRLLLRQFVHDDWPAMHDHYRDPECTAYTFRRALSEGESWRAMASMVGHWQLRGYGPFAVVEQDSQQVVGAVGLWYPNDWPEAEIKWALRKAFWGRGYAAEAVRAVQAPACQHPGNPPISFINGENQPSLQLAQAVGAQLEKVMEFRGAPWHMYRHPAAGPQ